MKIAKLPAQLQIREHIAKFHPLIKQTKLHLKERWNTQGRLSAGKDGLDMHVSREQVGRACRIMDTIIRTLEQQGAQVVLDPNEGTCMKLEGETVRFGLMEVVKQVKATKDPYHVYEFEPTGQLFLHIRGSYFGLRTKWSEGKRGRLEEKIISFIDGLQETVACFKKQRQEREEEHRQCQEAEWQRELKCQAREEEQKRRQALEAQALAWQRGRLLRAYIRARVKRRGAYTPESEFGQWVAWASAHADQLDPLKTMLTPIPV